jgi:hypothetical protein
MKPSPHEKYSLLDWLLFTAYEMQKLKFDKDTRRNLTGHDTGLGNVWIRSVGMWGRFKGPEFYDPQNPLIDGMKKSTFDQYKYRNRLKTIEQFCPKEADRQLWYVPQVCCGAILKIQARHDDCCPDGLAAYYAVNDYKLGLLPVEVVLWNTVFLDMLCIHGLSYEEWLQKPNEEKTELWDAGNEQGEQWDAEPFRYALEAKLY